MVGWQEHVRKYGVEKFIRLYNKLKVIDGLFTRSMHCSVVVLVHLYLCLQNDSGRGLKWGDEVEYIIVKLDHAAGPAHQARGGHVGKYSEATR